MYPQPLQIHIAMKQASKLRKAVVPQPLTLPATPETLSELIELVVKLCIQGYRERRSKAGSPIPLTEEQWDSMYELGKFAFGVQETEGEIDEVKALQTALTAIEDGLVRIFRDSQELSELHAPLFLRQGETLTFVRLTMLAGRLW